MDSFCAAADIRKLGPLARIGLLSSRCHPELLTRTRSHRLHGLIFKRDDQEEFHYAIKTMLGGGFYTPPALTNLIMDPDEHHDPIHKLTSREHSVFGLLAQGHHPSDR